MQRDRLGSRLGFLMLSAACAIGLGNVWKFPYMAGQYGGGAFVVVYDGQSRSEKPREDVSGA